MAINLTQQPRLRRHCCASRWASEICAKSGDLVALLRGNRCPLPLWGSSTDAPGRSCGTQTRWHTATQGRTALAHYPGLSISQTIVAPWRWSRGTPVRWHTNTRGWTVPSRPRLLLSRTTAGATLVLGHAVSVSYSSPSLPRVTLPGRQLLVKLCCLHVTPARLAPGNTASQG